MNSAPEHPGHAGQEHSPLPGVVWGVDVGLARVGVARCDPQGVLATPVETVSVGEGQAALDRVLGLVREDERSTGVVVGLPRHLDGHESTSAAEARRWAKHLAAALGPAVRVWLVDERMSTVAASRGMRQAGVRAKEQRDRIDQAAAVEILQMSLDAWRGGSRIGELVPGRKPRRRAAGNTP
ncbi:Holliday junction resolvase RuvX [Kytococcus sedentarius]|uniref:Holliday junction resolvase RuvX n=1 Tax=Kytococcus sedentarius TaxID=1276 RepID=UPI0035BC5772